MVEVCLVGIYATLLIIMVCVINIAVAIGG